MLWLQGGSSTAKMNVQPLKPWWTIMSGVRKHRNRCMSCAIFFLLQVLFDPTVQSPLNNDLSPLMAKTPSKAGADERIPPSQECSPHPGRKQQKSKQPTKPAKTAKNGECRPIDAVQIPKKKSVAHSDSQVLTRLKRQSQQKKPSKQGKS